MTVTEAVRTRILALSAVTAIVGTRVTSVLFFESTDDPSVRVQTISQVEDTQLRGAGGMRRSRVQVDMIALSLATVYALDAAVHGDGAGSGLSGWTGDVGSFRVYGILPEMRTEMFDPDELKLYRVSRDYLVMH